ncbi:MAG: DUF6577 family protein [Candidatus Bathyarchaeia archaeon]
MSVPGKVLEYVRDREEVSVDGLMDELGIARISARNYLSRLSGQGVLVRTGRGRYRMGCSGTRNIDIPPNVREVNEMLMERFPVGDFVVWSLGMLSNYSHYTLGRDLITVEADERLAPKIRDVLLKSGYNAVLDPGKKEYGGYPLYQYLFVVKRKERYGVTGNYPRLERLLVDVYFDITRNELSFSPSEYGVILGNALRTGKPDPEVIIKYASRRGIKVEVAVTLYEVMKRLKLGTDVFYKKDAQQVAEEIISGALE